MDWNKRKRNREAEEQVIFGTWYSSLWTRYRVVVKASLLSLFVAQPQNWATKVLYPRPLLLSFLVYRRAGDTKRELLAGHHPSKGGWCPPREEGGGLPPGSSAQLCVKKEGDKWKKEDLEMEYKTGRYDSPFQPL